MKDLKNLFSGLASDVSLDKYLMQNTSEDNVSFEVIMEEAAKKDQYRVHKAWLFEQEKQARDVCLIFLFKKICILYFIILF